MKFFAFILALFTSSDIEHLTVDAFYEKMMLEESYVLIDVRMYEKFCDERIENALWAGESSELYSILKTVPKDVPLFIYCSYGERTAEPIRLLKKKGYKKIYNLADGFEQWIHFGFPVDSSRICN